MPTHRIYKPTKNKDGHASQLDYRPNSNSRKRDAMLFWTITKQTGEDAEGNASFAWDKEPGKTIKMKLGLPDVGELLAVLEGQKDQVGLPGGNGLFHKNNNGNTGLKFFFKDGQYSLQISSQTGPEKTLLRCGHLLTQGEATVVKHFLIGYLNYNFDLTSQVNRELSGKQA